VRQATAAPVDIPDCTRRGRLILSVTGALLLVAADVRASGNPPPHTATAASQEADVQRDHEDVPCPGLADGESQWLERARAGVEHSVCVSAWRFDSLFGNREDEEIAEASAPYGRLRVGALWDERKGFDPEMRLLATVPLPLLHHRLHAIFGRDTDQQFIENQGREFSSDPLIGDENDSNWLLGLGYEPIRGRNSRLNLGAGVKLQTPLDPYVKATYRYYRPFGEDVIARAQQAVFWESNEGLGTSTRAGIDWLLSEERLLRWNNYFKLTEETRGTYWNTNVTLYQRLSTIRAVALRAGVRGETGREYGPVEYQLDLIYRQPFLRDWLFLEARGGGGWLRQHKADPREFVPRAALLFEMLFGRHPVLDYDGPHDD
jgi:hypothetical protein